MKKFLSVLLITVSLSGFAQGDHEGAKFRKIDSLMTYLYQNGKFMGSITLREKDRIVFTKAYGSADLATKTKATPFTRYKIGGITKMFTACMVFQLIEEKKLKPTTKLSEFFPKVKNAENITIYNLLNHTSGIYSYTADSTFISKAGSQQLRRDMLERVYKYPSVFDPGTKAALSDSNYLLLSYIIQDITHKTYKEAVTERILNKAGLKNTTYAGKINPKKNEASSYRYVKDHWQQVPEWHETAATGVGNLQSTPEDLTRFMEALWAGKIISKKSVANMATLDFGYGKGLLNFPFGERKFIGHSGSIEGFETVVGYYPKENFGIALAGNAVNFSFNDIVQGVLSCYYKLPYRFPVLEKADVDEDRLKQYEGNYGNEKLPFVINVKLVKGKLRVHADEQGTFYITPLSDNEFIHEGSGVKMTFDTKGFTLDQGGTTTYFTKK